MMTTLFAGCGSTGTENTADSTGSEAGISTETAQEESGAQSVAGTADTVIVAMSPSSEPAAGFNRASTGAAGSTAMSR